MLVVLNRIEGLSEGAGGFTGAPNVLVAVLVMVQVTYTYAGPSVLKV